MPLSATPSSAPSLVVRTVRYSPASGLSSLDAICQVQGDDGWRRVHQGS